MECHDLLEIKGMCISVKCVSISWEMGMDRRGLLPAARRERKMVVVVNCMIGLVVFLVGIGKLMDGLVFCMRKDVKLEDDDGEAC